MRAVIIAGGFGTRMRPLSLSRPKHLIPLANRPLLEYQIGILREAGIQEVIFATNHLAEQIESHFKDGSRFGITMSYRVEPEPMDTAGAIRYALDGLTPQPCVVFNGDTLHDFDLPAILRFHRERQAEVTLTLYRVNRPHPFGVVPLDENDRVLEFIEPSKEQKRAAELGERMEGSDLINAGLYVMEPGIIERIPMRKCSIEREFYPQILREGAKVLGFDAAGYWTDVGRPAQLMSATKALLSNELKLLKFAPGRAQDGVWQEENVSIAPTAQVERGCHLGAGCSIAENAKIRGYSVIGAGSRIGEGTELDGCILLENVTIGANCRLNRCVIDKDNLVQDHVRAREAVLAANGIVGAWSALGEPIL